MNNETGAGYITLLLMRHGKSDWTAGAASDFDRPLNKRGRKASARMGNWLLDNKLQPNKVIASPALRSRDTARIVAETIGLPDDKLILDARLYHAGVAQHLAVLQECAAADTPLLLVGHNPGLEELLDALCMNPPDTPKSGKMLPTAAVAVLHVPQALHALQPGQALLRELIRPRALDD